MKKINVTYFQRKPLTGHFSLEFIYEDVRARLAKKIDAHVHIARYYSTGLFKRLYNLLEAPFLQGDINHITGDIHYMSFFLKKNRTILTIADCVFMNTESALKRAVLKLFWLYLPSKRVAAIVAISEFTKSTILKHLPSFPAEQIKVISVAVSDNYTYSPKSFNESKPIILHIGTSPNKNLFRLLEAIKDISCLLIIVGRLNNEQVVKLAELGTEYENYSGLSEAELIALYQRTDMLAFVSTYEGFGMPIVEANRVGRPVITANISSMPEVAGNAALLVDPLNVESIKAGIIKIIEDKVYRAELVANGRINATRFDGDFLAKQYYKLYREVASRS